MCPNKSIWIKLVSGELDEQTSSGLRSHAAGCQHCAEELAAAGHVYETLGTWDVKPPHRDLAEEIVAAANVVERAPAAWWLRAAASVLVCASIGWLVGQTGDGTETTPVAQGALEEQVMLALGLDSVVEQADLLGAIDWTADETMRQQ
jgi:anti-sigma factor RsiW